jgi:hypothetical protein
MQLFGHMVLNVNRSISLWYQTAYNRKNVEKEMLWQALLILKLSVSQLNACAVYEVWRR